MLKGSKYPANKAARKFVFVVIIEKVNDKTTNNTLYFHGFGILIKKQQREYPPQMALVVATNTLKFAALGVFAYPISAVRVPLP